jgi:CRP/FNR family transcriptional regulator, cyclic AMP receptor protein
MLATINSNEVSATNIFALVQAGCASTQFMPDRLRELMVPTTYRRGTQLCLEGHEADGVFGICRGRAKEYVTSKRGKTVILRVLHPGDLVGLESVIGGSVHETTVETLESVDAYFLTKRDLLAGIQSDERLCVAVTRQLTDKYRGAARGIRRFRFGSSVEGRVADLLLEWQKRNQGNNSIHMALTHEEISQAIGTTRETVTRIVTRFQQRGWIRVTGDCWRIQNRGRLLELATQMRSQPNTWGNSRMVA